MLEQIEMAELRRWRKKDLCAAVYDLWHQVRLLKEDRRPPSQALLDEAAAWRGYGVRQALEVRKLRAEYRALAEVYHKVCSVTAVIEGEKHEAYQAWGHRLPVVPPGGRGGVD